MPTNNKELRAKHNRTYYLKNKEDRLRRNYEIRKRNQLFIRNIKTITPCADCGLNFHWFQMDFDHIGNDKTMDVGLMATQRLVSLETLQKEIDKCEVVCSNCHRMRTYNRSMGP